MNANAEIETGILSDSTWNLNNEETAVMTQQYVMNTYNRIPIALTKGLGTRVWDADGNSYLDFVTGLAVCSLGHCHPKVVQAIQTQASELLHVSNLFHIQPQARLARLLVECSSFDKVFFCNSGAEANEAAIKLARKYSRQKHGPGRYEVITAERSFHGRTLATVAATGQSKYHKGFEPLPEGFRYVPFNDLDAVKRAVNEKTCAIMLELVQGEGGVYPASPEYVQGVFEFCRENDLLLICDEVQTGLGRTGKLFAYEHFAGLRPDVVTLAKALGGGLAIGAMLATDESASGFEPGNHASTFGGNPLACTAGLAALEVIIGEGLAGLAAASGKYLEEKLWELNRKHNCISEIRGKGLMIGAELSIDGNQVVALARKRGLLLNCIGGSILRFLPPLNVSKDEIDEAVDILDAVFAECVGEKVAS